MLGKKLVLAGCRLVIDTRCPCLRWSVEKHLHRSAAEQPISRTYSASTCELVDSLKALRSACNGLFVFTRSLVAFVDLRNLVGSDLNLDTVCAVPSNCL